MLPCPTIEGFKGLAQLSSYLVLVSVNGLNGAPELVGNVELVGIEQEDDPVDPLGEPLEHAHEIVAAVGALLLAAQDAGGVDHRDALENCAVHGGALEAVEEGASEFRERPELPLVVHRERISRYDLCVEQIHVVSQRAIAKIVI